MMKRRKSTSKNNHVKDELEKMQSEFEMILSIVEAAVTSGLIAGITPKGFSTALSYHFLICATGTRAKSNAMFEKWTSDLAIVWDPVLNEVIDCIDTFESFDDLGEQDELNYLREGCGIRARVVLSELEERRDCNKAVEIMDWLMTTLSTLHVPSILVEMACLVIYFKAAALDGEMEDEDYILVRQYIPSVFEAYNPVLDRGALSLV